MLLAVLQLLASFITSHYITLIFVDDDKETLILAFIASIAKPIIHTTLDVLMNQASTKEATKIATSISTNMQKTMTSTANHVAADLPTTTVTNACNDSFYAYYYTTSQIIRLFPELVDFIVVIYVATDKSWMMTQIFLFGSSIILLVQRIIDKKMEKISKEMVVQTNLTRLFIARLWTNFFVWLQTPYDDKPPDPAEAISLGISQWSEKDQKTKLSHLLTEFMQGLFSLTCLLFVEKKTILIWLIMNHHRLWKGVRLWRRLSEIVIHNQAKMAIHLSNLVKCKEFQKIDIPVVEEKKGVITLTTINVLQANCPRIDLQSPVIILPNTRIILEGQKGSGKTYIISVLTRLIDTISNMYLENTKIEFNNLRIWKVFQSIASQYTENHKKTITHSLIELFPGASLSQIVHFLKMFDLQCIIPKGDNPLEIPLGKNETSLSPGTVRTIVLSSRLWKLQKLLESNTIIHVVILDEADTAIDFGTVEKCYIECIDPLLKKYGVPCIITSHSKEFRDLVKDRAGRDCKVLTANREGDTITYQ
jgi:ABC-type multidrug transport system fused ATPase/permease subunit